MEPPEESKPNDFEIIVRSVIFQTILIELSSIKKVSKNKNLIYEI